MIRKQIQAIIASYFRLSRIERFGYTTLLILLVLLISVWQLMPNFIKVDTTKDSIATSEMQTAYNEYRNKHLSIDDSQPVSSQTPSNIAVSLTPFDPNTLDSIGFLRLGLSPKVVKGLMNWRRHGKVFYKKEDLKPLYNLTEEEYKRLEQYIAISVQPTTKYSPTFERQAPLPAHINLNKTDSATLVRLNGIGPTLAHKIIKKRNELGGYHSHSQLMEVYKFSDSVFVMLQEKLTISPSDIRKININTATEEQLKQHPYIGEKYAASIIRYRNGLKRFDQLSQLRQVPLMTEEQYRKIFPYLTIE